MKYITTIFIVILLLSLFTIIGLIITYIWTDWTDLLSKILKTSILSVFVSLIIIAFTDIDNYKDDEY